MFRTLAARLVALWVLAALVLFAVTVVAVTAFSLSAATVATNQAMDATERLVPDEVRLAVVQHGSLAGAADDVVRDLARPGLRLLVFTRRHGPPDAVAEIDEGTVTVVHPQPQFDRDRGDERDVPTTGGVASGAPAVVGAAAGGSGGEPGPGPGPGGPDGRFVSGLPYGLDMLVRVPPRRIAVPGGRVVIVLDPRPIVRTLGAFLLAMLPVGLALVLAAIFVGRYLTGLALRPLAETTEALRRFASGDFTPRAVHASGRDEIGQLVVAYNGAAAQVAAAFEERRLADQQMRQFIGDAGHELRTPLTVIMGFVDVLRKRSAGDPATAKIHDTMLHESRRMRALVDRLILLARLENVQFVATPSLLDVGELASRVATTLDALQPRPRVRFTAEPDALAYAQESEIYEAVQNLVDNALKYAPLSPVDVRVAHEGTEIVVTVADHGPGIAEDDREHVFDRFYRGAQRGEREGFGLGLAIVKRAIARAGGTVTLASALGEGTTFTIRLPRATAAEERSA